MIELEQSFQNRTGRQNDKSARGHETAHCCCNFTRYCQNTFHLGLNEKNVKYVLNSLGKQLFICCQPLVPYYILRKDRVGSSGWQLHFTQWYAVPGFPIEIQKSYNACQHERKHAHSPTTAATVLLESIKDLRHYGKKEL